MWLFGEWFVRAVIIGIGRMEVGEDFGAFRAGMLTSEERTMELSEHLPCKSS